MSYFLGTLASIGVVWWTIILLHAKPSDFVDLHAFVIVVLGSMMGTATGGNMIHLVKLPTYILKAILPLTLKLENIVVDLKRMADKARANGLPALTSEIPTAPDEFCRRGIKMVVAGTDSKMVHTILDAEIESTEKRHHEVCGFLNGLGGNAPTFGLLGTVLGIVQGLGNLDDINALGHALAVALMATLYGVLSANALWLPLAQQLQMRSTQELDMRKMYMEGLLAIQHGYSSDLVDKLMKSYVSEKQRAKIEGGKVGGKKVEKHIEYTTYMNAQDQERALAFIAEIKKEAEAKNLGQDDVKTMLADLINEADDKTLCKDFATEYLKIKLVKKLPKGAKRKGGKKKKKGAGKKRLDD